MQLKHKITINFLEFFKTGKFDCLKLGQTKEYILNNFPDPDGSPDHFMQTHKNGDIWCYGKIELHFDAENRLFLIFSDYIDTLTGGNNLILEKWILETPQELNLINVIKHLNKENIDFEKRIEKTLGQIKIKLLKSNVNLSFLSEEISELKIADPNNYILGAFSLM